ncbi:methyl-accepting chemotaxis protein [Rhodopseudomonas thermotolerans]|jgi:methyl-accepting chemotaxis protein|uniref:Methyl-accepting chemotaxis protein n=2 Tax=Rhodopseudomonas TaxID=1073 RepID=A0A336JP91_9BRAD|nr:MULTISPECIES: methyl-accepting chemotaxis protein [Rhodopseudomonas]RED37756.1 methyl-accepting chemotaxis protein [Rhodopseudomonas pentothenatexigens]REG04490.1 methyl-accepting chemotaxis protein [Rhodopseudomonas thermotolerans]SSW90256.1 methyl-accepting chemotaxis protein [Rhodopseudomonas pentothenatexigens]
MSSAHSSHVSPAAAGPFSFFTNRKIGIKIAIGFAAVEVLLALLAILNYANFSKLGEAFSAFDQRVGVVDTVRDIELDFVSLRRTVREYSLTGDDALIAEAGKRRAELQDNIKRAMQQVRDPGRQASMVELGSKVDSYVAQFDGLTKLRQDQNQLSLTVLGPVGQRIVGRLEQLQSATMSGDGNSDQALLVGQSMKQFLLLRLFASKVLGIHLEKAAQASAEKALADFRTALSTMKTVLTADSERKQLAAIEADLAIYADGYQRSVRDVNEIDATITAMTKVAQSLAGDAAAIKQSGVAEQKQIGHQTTALIGETQNQILFITLGAMALGFLLAWLIGRAVSKPIVAMSGVMKELAAGNTDVEIVGSGRLDEIGLMACTVEVFRNNALECDRLKTEQEEAERRVAAEHKAEMQRLADHFEGAVGEIIDTVTSASTELEASAGTLTTTAERSQELACSVAAASEQASSNVQSVASATEEMASSITEISRQVQEAARIANEAVDQARKTNDRIGTLAQAANRIGDVVDLINTIAGQTNLLALNATIEAARAGDAGRGFAVVAQEVKALAEQTGKATGEISAQISSMQSATQESVGAIREIGGTIERMSEIASTIASAVEEQGAATQEISRNVQQAARGTHDVSSNIADVQRGATETGSASSQVLSAAQSLSRDSTRLKDEVDRFMETVRAA